MTPSPIPFIPSSNRCPPHSSHYAILPHHFPHTTLPTPHHITTTLGQMNPHHQPSHSYALLHFLHPSPISTPLPPPQDSYYTYGSFTLPDGECNNNIVGSNIYNAPTSTTIASTLSWYQNILWAELYAIMLTTFWATYFHFQSILSKMMLSKIILHYIIQLNDHVGWGREYVI